MANIKIEIAENGLTTLATAGKYCDRNIDIDVNVAGGGGGDITVEPLVLTGEQTYSCSGQLAGQYLELFGDTISTENLGDSSYMFYKSNIKEVPFDLNFQNSSSTANTVAYLFGFCQNLESVPIIRNLQVSHGQRMFQACYRLREIPDEVFENWNFTKQNAYGNFGGMVMDCYSLRKFPTPLFKTAYSQSSTSYLPFSNLVANCYAMDEVTDIPAYMPVSGTAMTSNMFSGAFAKNYKLGRVTFETNEDGTAKTVQWKNQTIDLTGVGYANGTPNVLYNYNSGITQDKLVTNATTYQALKNDPDWHNNSSVYANYDKASALETINSLPDTSAYLAIAGGSNTIKFFGTAGAKTDAGAINTLTAEEIAIATAKGWTVTFV